MAEEALRALDLLDQGCFDESLEEIRELSAAHSREPERRVVQELLGLWLELKTRSSQAERCPPMDAPVDLPMEKELSAPPPSEGDVGPRWIRALPPTRPTQDWESLKEKGRRLYSEGRIQEALGCWQEVLTSRPEDEEARRLVRRAETVLTRTDAQ